MAVYRLFTTVIQLRRYARYDQCPAPQGQSRRGGPLRSIQGEQTVGFGFQRVNTLLSTINRTSNSIAKGCNIL